MKSEDKNKKKEQKESDFYSQFLSNAVMGQIAEIYPAASGLGETAWILKNLYLSRSVGG